MLLCCHPSFLSEYLQVLSLEGKFVRNSCPPTIFRNGKGQKAEMQFITTPRGGLGKGNQHRCILQSTQNNLPTYKLMQLKQQQTKGIGSKGHENLYKGNQYVLLQQIFQAQSSHQALCNVGLSASLLFFGLMRVLS